MLYKVVSDILTSTIQRIKSLLLLHSNTLNTLHCWRWHVTKQRRKNSFMTSDGDGFSNTPQYYILLTLPILYFEVMYLFIRKYIIWITDVLRSSESHLRVNNGYIRAAQCHIVPTLFILLDNLTIFNTFRHLAPNGRRTVIVDLDRRTADFKSLRLLKHLLGDKP